MNQDPFFKYTVFNKNIRGIGLLVHEQVLNVLYENITDPEIISILIHRGSNWFDGLRSSIIWYCNEIVGGNPEKTVKIGAMMSLIGSGLGIHDDIIDRTSVKRSRKTVLEVCGPRRGLVVGDLYIVKGLTSMALLLNDFEKKVFFSLVDIFKDFFNEMAEAQLIEISLNKKLDYALDYYHGMLWKLGVDLRVCAELGAISGTASANEINTLSDIGSSIGYINRLNEEINDVLNINGNLGMRLKNESIPLGLVFASKQSDLYYKTIKEIIDKKEPNEKDIKKIIKICEKSGAINYIKREIEKKYLETKTRIEFFPESHSQKMLKWILFYMVNRNDVLKNEEKLPA